MGEVEVDPLRDQLLEAAARVFAAKGFAGTKIMDIVKEAGLSSGAVYGRFESKEDLLMEAVLDQVGKSIVTSKFDGSVAQTIAAAINAEGDLSQAEALRLEAYVAARREDKVAEAIDEMRQETRGTTIKKIVDQAVVDGLASESADFESIVYLFETLNLGLLLQRGAGQFAPDPEKWRRFMYALVLAMAAPVRTN